jgi:TPR repeat protein
MRRKKRVRCSDGYGQGVPTSYLQAAMWWRKAAEQGNTDAQVQLGILYQIGLAEEHDASDEQAIYDAPKVKGSDFAQAIFWFRRAADKSNASAEFSLGDMYEEGKGVPQDFTEAAFWYRKAAEQGHATAQFSIGVAYYNGQGVPQDYAEAYFWLDLAAMGNAASFLQANIEKTRDEAAANLTKTVLLQTQERARKWFEDHPVQTNPQ